MASVGKIVLRMSHLSLATALRTWQVFARGLAASEDVGEAVANELVAQQQHGARIIILTAIRRMKHVRLWRSFRQLERHGLEKHHAFKAAKTRHEAGALRLARVLQQRAFRLVSRAYQRWLRLAQTAERRASELALQVRFEKDLKRQQAAHSDELETAARRAAREEAARNQREHAVRIMARVQSRMTHMRLWRSFNSLVRGRHRQKRALTSRQAAADRLLRLLERRVGARLRRVLREWSRSEHQESARASARRGALQRLYRILRHLARSTLATAWHTWTARLVVDDYRQRQVNHASGVVLRVLGRMRHRRQSMALRAWLAHCTRLARRRQAAEAVLLATSRVLQRLRMVRVRRAFAAVAHAVGVRATASRRQSNALRRFDLVVRRMQHLQLYASLRTWRNWVAQLDAMADRQEAASTTAGERRAQSLRSVDRVLRRLERSVLWRAFRTLQLQRLQKRNNTTRHHAAAGGMRYVLRRMTHLALAAALSTWRQAARSVQDVERARTHREERLRRLVLRVVHRATAAAMRKWHLHLATQDAAHAAAGHAEQIAGLVGDANAAKRRQAISMLHRVVGRLQRLQVWAAFATLRRQWQYRTRRSARHALGAHKLAQLAQQHSASLLLRRFDWWRGLAVEAQSGEAARRSSVDRMQRILRRMAHIAEARALRVWQLFIAADAQQALEARHAEALGAAETEAARGGRRLAAQLVGRALLRMTQRLVWRAFHNLKSRFNEHRRTRERSAAAALQLAHMHWRWTHAGVVRAWNRWSLALRYDDQRGAEVGISLTRIGKIAQRMRHAAAARAFRQWHGLLVALHHADLRSDDVAARQEAEARADEASKTHAADVIGQCLDRLAKLQTWRAFSSLKAHWRLALLRDAAHSTALGSIGHLHWRWTHRAVLRAMNTWKGLATAGRFHDENRRQRLTRLVYVHAQVSAKLVGAAMRSWHVFVADERSAEARSELELEHHAAVTGSREAEMRAERAQGLEIMRRTFERLHHKSLWRGFHTLAVFGHRSYQRGAARAAAVSTFEACARRFQHQSLARGLTRWQAFGVEASTTAERQGIAGRSMRRVAARLEHRSLGCAWRAWQAVLADHDQRHSGSRRLARATLHLVQRLLARGFATWVRASMAQRESRNSRDQHEHHQQQHHRSASLLLLQVVRRLQLQLAARAVRSWLGSVAGEKAAEAAAAAAEAATNKAAGDGAVVEVLRRARDAKTRATSMSLIVRVLMRASTAQVRRGFTTWLSRLQHEAAEEAAEQRAAEKAASLAASAARDHALYRAIRAGQILTHRVLHRAFRSLVLAAAKEATLVQMELLDSAISASHRMRDSKFGDPQAATEDATRTKRLCWTQWASIRRVANVHRWLWKAKAKLVSSTDDYCWPLDLLFFAVVLVFTNATVLTLVRLRRRHAVLCTHHHLLFQDAVSAQLAWSERALARRSFQVWRLVCILGVEQQRHSALAGQVMSEIEGLDVQLFQRQSPPPHQQQQQQQQQQRQLPQQPLLLQSQVQQHQQPRYASPPSQSIYAAAGAQAVPRSTTVMMVPVAPTSVVSPVYSAMSGRTMTSSPPPPPPPPPPAPLPVHVQFSPTTMSAAQSPAAATAPQSPSRIAALAQQSGTMWTPPPVEQYVRSAVRREARQNRVKYAHEESGGNA